MKFSLDELLITVESVMRMWNVDQVFFYSQSHHSESTVTCRYHFRLFAMHNKAFNHKGAD